MSEGKTPMKDSLDMYFNLWLSNEFIVKSTLDLALNKVLSILNFFSSFQTHLSSSLCVFQVLFLWSSLHTAYGIELNEQYLPNQKLDKINKKKNNIKDRSEKQ